MPMVRIQALVAPLFFLHHFLKLLFLSQMDRSLNTQLDKDCLPLILSLSVQQSAPFDHLEQGSKIPPLRTVNMEIISPIFFLNL